MKFKPQNPLEEAVMKADSNLAIIQIMEGHRLTRPDVWVQEPVTQLTLSAAMMMAHIGVPEDLRDATLDYVKDRCGEDSELFDFLLGEFNHSPSPLSTEEERLLRAIREEDEFVVVAISKLDGFLFSEKLPLKYLPFLKTLSPECRDILFHDGCYPYSLVMLLKDLIAPDLKGVKVPVQVQALTYDKRIGMINEILSVLMHSGEEEDEEEDGDEDEGDEEDEAKK